ncbi:MAG TPA: response regulator [Gemmatimonadales bacterium]|jgi:CheY-like chemotaxis protein|nr:response regulator [Gemmatimonadales bacterium]
MELECVVLVADDEPGVRSFASRIIKSAGYAVLEARDGVEALGMVHASGAELRLVITDVRMPRLRGDQLASRLAAERPDVSVLFMSASPPSGLEMLAEEERQSRWLRKPFTPGTLTGMVARYLGAKR